MLITGGKAFKIHTCREGAQGVPSSLQLPCWLTHCLTLLYQVQNPIDYVRGISLSLEEK